MQKSLCLVLTIFLISIFITQNANAAFLDFFKKKPKPDKKFFIQNQVSINKKFESQNGTRYDLRLNIDIPYDANGAITVAAFYDEASEQAIEDIAWIIVHKTKETKIPRSVVKQEINKVYEQLAINQDPSLSYDRITEEKHIINKYFLFPRKSIIPEVISLKTIRENYLEITFADSSIKRIAINKYIYPFSDLEAKPVQLPVERTKMPKIEPEKPKAENKAELQNRIQSQTTLQPPPPSNNSYLNLNNPQGAAYPEESNTAKELEELKNELDQYMREVYSEEDSEDGIETEF